MTPELAKAQREAVQQLIDQYIEAHGGRDGMDLGLALVTLATGAVAALHSSSGAHLTCRVLLVLLGKVEQQGIEDRAAAAKKH